MLERFAPFRLTTQTELTHLLCQFSRPLFFRVLLLFLLTLMQPIRHIINHPPFRRPFPPLWRRYASVSPQRRKVTVEDRPLRNMEIVKHLREQRRPLRAFVVDENGQLNPEPANLLHLLERINQKDPAAGIKFPEYLVQFLRENHDPEDPASPPTVKLISKRDMYLGDKAKKEKSFNARVVEKEVQMRWVISEVDFERKMEQIRKELEKGHRVNIVITVRGGKKVQPPTRDAKQETIERIAEALKETGKPNQPPEIDRRMTVLQYWPLSKGSDAASNKTADTVRDRQENDDAYAARQL